MLLMRVKGSKRGTVHKFDCMFNDKWAAWCGATYYWTYARSQLVEVDPDTEPYPMCKRCAKTK